MRLFIALPVPEDELRRLTETQTALRKKGVRGRFSPAENLHMTVVFIGSVPDGAPAVDAMKSVRLPKKTLRFERLTMFGDVLVALYKPDGALSSYAKELREALAAREIPFDRKAFRPHITLCRKTEFPSDDFRLFRFEKSLKGSSLTVSGATLMSSDLSGDRPEYTPLHTERAKR